MDFYGYKNVYIEIVIIMILIDLNEIFPMKLLAYKIFHLIESYKKLSENGLNFTEKRIVSKL